MADVFIASRVEDLTKAEDIARAFESSGYSVWHPGRDAGHAVSDAAVERELRAARAVVVLWSRASVRDTAFVRAYAEIGRAHDKLVAVKVGPCDPPLAFRVPAPADLISWSSKDTAGREWERTMRAVATLVARPAGQVLRARSGARVRQATIAIASLAGLVALVTVALVLRPQEQTGAPGRQAPEAAVESAPARIAAPPPVVVAETPPPPAPVATLDEAAARRAAETLSETLGGAHYLHTLCAGREEQRWRDQQRELIQRLPDFNALMVDAFNRGYRARQAEGTSCTDAARANLARMTAQAERQGRQLAEIYSYDGATAAHREASRFARGIAG